MQSANSEQAERVQRTPGKGWPSKAELEQTVRDCEIMTNFRILGASDAFISALIAVRRQVRSITGYKPIDPRHVRKIAEREKLLAPLRALERTFEQSREVCSASFEKRESERKAHSQAENL